jgi:hypothetical protein
MSSPERPPSSDRPGPSPRVRAHRRAQLAAVVELVVSVAFLMGLLSLVADDLDGLVAAFVWLFMTAFFGWFVVTRRGYLRLLGLPLVLLGLIGLMTYAYDHKVALPMLIGVLALFGLAAR